MNLTNFQPKRLLVTGGAGFLGSHFVDHWLSLADDHFVVVLDALTYAGDRTYLDHADAARMQFVHDNILHGDLVRQLLEDFKLDTIAHFAAETHVDRSLSDPDIFITSNVLGTQRLLEAARLAWAKKEPLAHRFHMVSTDEVYGELKPGNAAWKEGQPYAPNSPYSASKAAADHLVRAYHRSFGLAVSWSHSCNAYGPRQYPEKLIPVALKCWLHDEPAPLYAGGHQIREWMYASDQADGVAKILRRGQAGRAYHLGGSKACTNLELLRLLWQQFTAQRTTQLSFADAICSVEDRLGHDQAYGLDGSRAEHELQFQPGVELAEGLAKTVGWYLKRWDAPT
ncbi:MAG: GDP-mannose 4,6-dehydratase [Planctomycetes bacterium]|nr:GDP-mannose 4,6-dehydratase [Planctomycetota bacterium]